MSGLPPLSTPERPAGVPPRAEPPDDDLQWRAALALPVALMALVAGVLALTAVTVLRDLVSEPSPHRDGIVGVALHGTPPVVSLVATLAQGIGLIVGSVLAAGTAARRVRPADFGLRPARIASSVGLVLAGYVAFVLTAFAWTSLLDIQERENVAVELGTRDSLGALVGAALLVCVVAPLAEELFFRGYLFRALRRRGLLVAAGVTGLAFGLAHVASSPIGFLVPLAVLGVMLCLLYERTGSLYPCIGLHCLNNSIAFGAADGRAWLIGACLVGGGLILIVLLRLAQRLSPDPATA